MRRYLLPGILSLALVVACDDDAPHRVGRDTDPPEIQIVAPAAIGLTPATLDPDAPVALEVTGVGDPPTGADVRLALENITDHDDSYSDTEDYVRSHPDDLEWTPWTPYESDDSSYMLYRPDEPFPFGGFVLAAQARDAAGNVSSLGDDNVRRVLVATRTSGPLLAVRDQYVGGITTAVCTTPRVVGGVISVLPVAFEYRVSAEAYGGRIASYRYGWFDPDNLDDPTAWIVVETPSLPLEVAGVLPGHPISNTRGEVFRFEATDWAGLSSCVTFDIARIDYAPSRDILLVDDFRAEHSSGWAGTNGFAPSDAEHDQFWEAVLADVEGFNVPTDVIEVNVYTTISWLKFLDYRALVWSVSTGGLDGRPDQSLLSTLIRFRPEWEQFGPQLEPTAGFLAQYLRAGGLIVITGWYPLFGALEGRHFPGYTPRFPLVYKYELEGDQDGNYIDQNLAGEFVGDESFPYRDLCVNVVDYTNPYEPTTRTEADNLCGRDFDREIDEALRQATSIDPGFPLLTLRPEVAGPGRGYAEGGLLSELYNPDYFNLCPFSEYTTRTCFEPIYGVGAVDPLAVTQGSPAAFWTSASPTASVRSAVFGVPLVFFEPAQAKEAVERIVFDEWGMARKP